ncbi:MAG: hypothetical protein AB7O52_04605 [Planctomycetota bacterium]
MPTQGLRLLVPRTVFVVSCVLPAFVGAQDLEFRLGEVTTYPGAIAAVPLTVTTVTPLHGFQVAMAYDAFKANYVGFELADVLAGVDPEIQWIMVDPSAGHVDVTSLLDSLAPFDDLIPVGVDQGVATLRLEIENGLSPGTLVFVDFRTTPGDLPNMALAAGVEIPAAVANGSIEVTDENILFVGDSVAGIGVEGHRVPLMAVNTDDLQGLSISGAFDTAYVIGQDVTIDGTITEAVGAEFFEANIDNALGTFVVGILLDLLPPFDSQSIPPIGQAQTIAQLVVAVRPEAIAVSEVAVTLEDGFGTPPVQNVFVIDLQSVSPLLMNGVIEIIPQRPFLRGDANDDLHLDLSDLVVLALVATGAMPSPPCVAALDVDDNAKVQISDAVSLGTYLFLEGVPPAAPFPSPGTDPTAPYLACP